MTFSSVSDYLVSLGFTLDEHAEVYRKGVFTIPLADIAGHDVAHFQQRAEKEGWEIPTEPASLALAHDRNLWPLLKKLIPSLTERRWFFLQLTLDRQGGTIDDGQRTYLLCDERGEPLLGSQIWTDLVQIFPEWKRLALTRVQITLKPRQMVVASIEIYQHVRVPSPDTVMFAKPLTLVERPKTDE